MKRCRWMEFLVGLPWIGGYFSRVLRYPSAREIRGVDRYQLDPKTMEYHWIGRIDDHE